MQYFPVFLEYDDKEVQLKLKGGKLRIMFKGKEISRDIQLS